MEHLIVSPDLLRLAGLSQSDAQSLLYEAAAEESSEPTLKPDAASILARHIAEVKKGAMADKFNQGVKQRSKDIEGKIKPLFEKFGVDSPEDVLKGIEHLAEKIELAAKEKPSLADLTDDEVMKLPAFQKRLNTELAQARQAQEALKKAHEDFVQQVEREKKDSIFFGHVEAVLNKANAAFAPNRAAQLRHFFNGLEREYFHLSEGTIELLDKDGIALRGPNKEMMTFDEYVLAKWQELGYGFIEANPNPPTPGKPGDRTHLTTSAAVAEAIKIEKDPVKRSELVVKLAELRRAGK